MKPLETPDSTYLEAAKGWCGLKAFLEANEELDRISPSLRAHPLVLEVRWHIYANLQNWVGALNIAGALVKLSPDWLNAWIYHATSFAELNRPEEACDTLKAAAKAFPTSEIVHYNLACMCCRLKRFEEAEFWLGEAVLLGGKAMKLKALDDPEIKPLWRHFHQ